MDVEQVKEITWKSCLRKQNLSEEAANRIIDENASQGRMSYFYKCILCGSFHITSKEPIPDNKLNVRFS